MDSLKILLTICLALLCNASRRPTTDAQPFNAAVDEAVGVDDVHPAMTEEERILSKHFPNKDDWDTSDYANSEDYDDDTDLDAAHFDQQLQEADALDTQAPMFLHEPQSAFVWRGQAATLRCGAAHAMQVKKTSNWT